MLALRLSADGKHADELVRALVAKPGVERLVRARSEGPGEAVVLSADLAPYAADEVVELIQALGVGADDYLLIREDVIAPRHSHGGASGADSGFVWLEIVGEARANSRPLARYLTLIAVAGVIAALGVITSNGILIVGAMAVSPDLLPICATSVGLVARRFMLASRALVTLTLGLALVACVAAALTLAVDATGILATDFNIGKGGLGTLATTDYSTVLIALAAGVAAILSFETRASQAVGVAISVTTIPASAYLGVAIGAGEASQAAGALLVLAVNVVLLILSGTLTLTVQRRFA